ncbi:MAG: DMT family transporter [SAR324 cluster bacterium]|jgi:drug/metabolite transporter (DMT)-like permease|nr:DMT family transporter [SAR324 cluster bacterium]MEC9460101.1 DMT family transporter [SAR324 cluster bacterium]
MIVRAYIFLIIACIFWSFNPVANKIALDEIAVPQLVFMRTFLSAIIMLIVTLCMGHGFRLKQIGWRPFLLGVLDPGLTSLLFVTSLTLVSASNTVLVMALMPFSQPIIARLVLKEEVQPSIWFGAILVLFGFSIFFLGENIITKDSLLGNVLLMTVFCLFTFSQLITRKIMLTKISTFVVTSSQMVSASVIMFLNLMFFGNLKLPFQASSGTIMTFVYLVFSLAIPFFLYNQAMRHIPVGMASLFLVLVIPLGFLFAAIFTGEEITLFKTTGAVLVMIGVVLPHLLQIVVKRFSV